MKIFANELVKALLRKTTIGIFIALAVLNGVLIYLNNKQELTNFTAEDYKAVYADLDGLSAQEAYDKLKDEYDELTLIDMMSFGEDISDYAEQYPRIDLESVIEKYESKKYLVYTDNIYSEQELLITVLDEVSCCANYDDYLTGIDNTAKQMTRISLFADPDTFSYRNIAKTPDDFTHLKGSTLEIAPSRGIESATDFLVTDLIAMLMLLTVTVTIVTREKELNQLLLTRTTFKGRKNLGNAKLMVCFTASLVIEILLWGINFAVSYFTYGFGDLSRQLQSVSLFNGSNLKISVLEYFMLFFAAKLAVYVLFSALIYLVAVVSDSAVKVYAVLVTTLAVEAVLYYTIPSTSYFCLLKYVNIVAYANTQELFASYLNLNIFGQPVNYIPVFVISVAVILAAFSVISIIAFSKKKAIKSRSSRFSLKKISVFKGRNTSIFFHETYKIFIGGKALIILIIFAIITAVSYEPMTESFSSADDVYYKQYMLKLEGEYTTKKQEYIDSEEQKFNEAQTNMSKDLAELDGDNVLVIMKYQDILAPQFAFEKVMEQAKYLKTTDGGEFVYDTGYKLLTGDESAGNKDLTLALTAVVLCVLCLTYAYSNEFQTGANILLKTSKMGRYETFLTKLFIGIIITFVIFILTYAPYFYNVLSCYGTRGINAPICSIQGFSSWSMSIKGYLIFISVARYIAMIDAMLIIFFVSCKTKSFISALLVNTAVLVVPILMSLLGVSVFDYFLLNLLWW